MRRYFLEVAYKGEGLSGFQIQENAHTVQSEVEKALRIYLRKEISLTGSSRTDAGVHALQNFFHFDWEGEFNPKWLYNLNAILPPGIVLNSLYETGNHAHCRFHALSRTYHYYIYVRKDPFMIDRGWYFPYKFNAQLLDEAADYIKRQTNFSAFSKRNTQVKSFHCNILESQWSYHEGVWCYKVQANRFLRGMVRGLVGTMMKIARSSSDIQYLHTLFQESRQATADFSAPAQGLFLVKVEYPDGMLRKIDGEYNR